MTIAELIKKLQDYHPDTKVFYSGEYCCGEVTVVKAQPPHSDFDKENECVVLYSEEY